MANRFTESRIQAEVIKWFELMHRSLGVPDSRLLFAIPNGGARHIRTGVRLKAEGVRAGIPDLFLSVPRRIAEGQTELSASVTGLTHMRYGLYIELKTWEGKTSDPQRQVMAALRSQGYEVALARGVAQAQQAITAYCNGREVEL